MQSTGLRTRYRYSRHSQQTSRRWKAVCACLSWHQLLPVLMASRHTPSQNAAGDEQVYRVDRTAGHLYIRTVYGVKRTDTESLGQTTIVRSFPSGPIHHPLIPPRTTSPGRGLLRNQSGPGPTPKDSPHFIPSLNSNRRYSLLPDVPLDAFVNDGDRVPGEGGMVIPLAQKVSIDDGGE